MRYRVRYRDTNLFYVKDPLTGEDCKMQKYKQVKTLVTKVDGDIYQYSTAFRNSDQLMQMNLFGVSTADSEKYQKIDALNFYHDEADYHRKIAGVNTLKELRKKVLLDYDDNVGTELLLAHEIGSRIDGGICAGYVITQTADEFVGIQYSLNVAPIVVRESKWEEFEHSIRYTRSDSDTTDPLDLITSLLLER